MTWPAGRTTLIVGGGFSGSLLALRLRRADAGLRVVIVESARRIGRGVAYGACGPGHLLNVPASRMEVGLTPSFADWLRARPEAIADALEEAGGDIAAAFVPRALFGDYMQARVAEAVTTAPGPGLAAVRGEAVALLDSPRRGVRLADGREIEAETIVLATGNLAPRPPGGPDGWFYDTPVFRPDPWSADAFQDLDPAAPVLLLGTGLTTVDVALRLADAGHSGPMLAISRRGLTPKAHRYGGQWREPLDPAVVTTPLAGARLLRRQACDAETADVPWQRVFDAARPAVAAIWEGWTLAQRARFLRHLRPHWDVHRHRMAPRIASALARLQASGQLKMRAARVAGYRLTTDGVDVRITPRGGGEETLTVAAVINCTGPRADFDRIATPLVADLRQRRLIAPDALGLGLLTDDCALLDASGAPSRWLFALGPLTRPALWEIVAVPEITVQVDRLAVRLAGDGAVRGRTSEAFLDLGAGI